MACGLRNILLVAVTTACARQAIVSTSISGPAVARGAVPTVDADLIRMPERSAGPADAVGRSCEGCGASAFAPEETQALERRIADLKSKGGVCSSYAAVLERSYRSGQITVIPYMWRVGTQLTSGSARPDGSMILAREIDPLNVGVRSFDDVVWTMEHEAAHIAFNLDSPLDRVPGDRADQLVRLCRS